MLNTSLFGPLKLRRGAGGDYKNGLCFMEAAAWLAGEEATDKPECACPVLGTYGILINDHMSDATRQKLLPLAYEMAGTRDQASEEKREKFLAKHTRRMILEYCERARRERMPVAVLRGLVQCAERMEEDYRRGYWRDSTSAVWQLLRGLEYERTMMAELPSIPSYIDISKSEIVATMHTRIHTYDLRDRLGEEMIEILAAAIRLGPNGAAAWQDYIAPATKLGEFAKRELERV
jgi:hypothetical protein